MCLTLTVMIFFNFLDVCLHYVKNEKEKSVEKWTKLMIAKGFRNFWDIWLILLLRISFRIYKSINKKYEILTTTLSEERS